MRGIERHWQEDTWLSRLLLPLSWLYHLLFVLHRELYRRGWRRVRAFPVPVIVIGNVTVGGTGKTPLVTWIARFLKTNGWNPGIVTRGYGGNADEWPQEVHADSNPALVGDEPVLLAHATAGRVVADPDRARGVERLLALGCNVIVSDDGLQHFRLRRDVEIAVVDGKRRLGNGRWLPAGPLRESAVRLRDVDARVINGGEETGAWSMRLLPLEFRRVSDPATTAPLDFFRGQKVHAVAGIGYPPRFFMQLRALGAILVEHAFPDHHSFTPADLRFDDEHPVIMTEKDAVKCRSFATASMWYLAVEATLDSAFGDWLLQRLRNKADG